MEIRFTVEIIAISMLPKNNNRLVNAWTSFDWANSVYNLIVTTAIFPIYYLATTQEAFKGEMVEFMGMELKNSVLYSYAIAFSFLLIVGISPLLSGMADFGGRKKSFMQFFTYVGGSACIGLYFFTGANVEYGIACAILASVGYAGSLVFYNAFLPLVATPDKVDSVSARGFAMGYIGSVLLLLVNLIMFQKPNWFGFANGTAATRFGFILVGVWWMGFAQIAFYHLKDEKRHVHHSLPVIVNKGWHEIKTVYNAARHKRVLLRFLCAFFLYSMGVQTVMLLAPLFADKEVGMGADELIIIVLILQLVAIAGAYLFAWLSGRKGNAFAISITLGVWVAICITGFYTVDKITFYMLAAALGLVMGGIQSLSRSTYAKLISGQMTDTASYFSFYDITEKVAIVLGTFSYGLIEQLTGSMRNSMIFMALFFIAGWGVLRSSGLRAGLPPVHGDKGHG